MERLDLPGLRENLQDAMRFFPSNGAKLGPFRPLQLGVHGWKFTGCDSSGKFIGVRWSTNQEHRIDIEVRINLNPILIPTQLYVPFFLPLSFWGVIAWTVRFSRHGPHQVWGVPLFSTDVHVIFMTIIPNVKIYGHGFFGFPHYKLVPHSWLSWFITPIAWVYGRYTHT